MALAIWLLFGLLFAFFMGITYLLFFLDVIGGIWIVIIPSILAVGIVLLQWGISPYVLKWVYKIEWLTPDMPYMDPKYARVFNYIQKASKEAGVKEPIFGIVPDDNPNAFTFGWTRNKSFLVITRGVFKYCDDEEVEAVAAHEMGHIVHNDFVVMTVVTAVVLLFYVIAMGGYWMARASRFRGGRNQGQAAALILIIAAISYLVYILANFISLLISRYREYWADDFSAESTKLPNKLSSGLVKIAYGLATEGQGKDDKERNRIRTRHENALMIFNAKTARSLAVQAATPSGTVSKEAIKETMAWDLWNPWAFFYELKMTHPLTAKRIKVLSEKAESMGQMPYVKFDLVKPESYWDDFLKDIGARGSWLLSIPIAFLVWWYLGLNVISTLGLFLLLAALFGLLYLRFYRYPPGFKDAKVLDLLRDPKAGPVRGIPVRLTGKLIGRGVPGLFFSEDYKMDDGTGLMLIDYRSMFRIVDLLVGVFKTQAHVGQEVVVEGWYRRPVVPMLEMVKLQGPEVRRSIYRPYIEMAVVALLLVVGALITAAPFIF
jgi:Zn-dependent protease with chaperone function